MSPGDFIDRDDSGYHSTVDLSGVLMDLTQILILFVLAAAVGLFAEGRVRLWSLYLLSLFAVYLFQPLVPLRNYNYWFPTASILLTVVIWFLLRRPDIGLNNQDITSMSLAVIVTLIIAGLSHINIRLPWIPEAAPGILQILFLFVLSVVIIALISVKESFKQIAQVAAICFLVALFIALKTEPITLWLSRSLRGFLGQSISLSSTMDLSWLGFSYTSFRLLHTIREKQAGRLDQYSLREFATYVLFFPALVAGPIDRIERFIGEVNQSNSIGVGKIIVSGKRLATGLFKKFILADGLAYLALNPTNAPELNSTGWTWVLLYAYALRLYFDFSGYTDIAIGSGMLVGVTLPENFDRPYLKKNLTSFWNSWHKTLARWFRFYFFNPLTRWLRSGALNASSWLIIFTGQLLTMLLIGLWHGVTWNFAIWGIWHGVGLFMHNRWVAFVRNPSRQRFLSSLPPVSTQFLGVLLTFHFTALGWVWFALPTVNQSVTVFRMLFAVGG